ncbi:hypothetical protein DFH07DRAFT_1055067 [Mycena maculata]|uniref:Uncharacterized protein n=1 Tax=Mycena maculata TaxID=230809 RepID=A0AAD7KEH5_9AGAR|nr:hypothetical protein DFH07DRAFT_1055067 [Mycena maculata]
MSRIPDNGTISLSAIINSLNTMAGVAQLCVPYVQPVILLASAIICGIQQLKDNKRAFTRLAHDAYAMVQAVAQVHIHSVELQHSIEKFTAVLQQIQYYLHEHRTRNLMLRFFGAAQDAVKIREYRGQIQSARELLELQIEMRTHENIILMLRERSERNASPPPPYTAEDLMMPEDVRRIAQEDFERLLPILGVFSVFQEPPTIKQITRVLGLAEGEVQAVWGPILAYLDELDSDGRTRCLEFLERLVCLANNTPSIDSPTYHNLVARWCLLGPKGGAKDVFYAANSWAHHVCYSNPSVQLRDALMQSDIPLASESYEDLPEIIAWLEGIHHDAEQWAELLSTYRARLATRDDDGLIF